MLYLVIIFVTREMSMTGRDKRKILNISLPPRLYREVEELAKEQAKAKGEFVREVLRQYVEVDRRWKQIRKWGEESAKRLKIKGERGVENVIEQYRKDQSP
jgi:metal-responsive CopG/Arc/MetJ family transcriptional regulator